MQEAWRGGIRLDLCPEPVHVHVDRARLTGVVVAPDLLQELVAGEDLAGVAEQEGEQLEGLGLDRQLLAVAEQPMAGQVDLDVVEQDRRRGLRARATPARSGAGGRARAPGARAG